MASIQISKKKRVKQWNVYYVTYIHHFERKIMQKIYISDFKLKLKMIYKAKSIHI